jgi:heavy metal translocating P-type ATPase
MRRVLSFLKQYYLFSTAVATVIAGLILQFSHQSTALHWLLGIVAIIEVVPLLWGMVEDVRNGTYGIDILAATAIVSAVVFKQYWAAIVVVVMLTGGETLEDYAEHRAKSELDALLSRAPKQAHVLKKGIVVDVPVSQVHVGDQLIIRPGELVPVDAVIIDGAASFDESSLTGESLPQAKDIHDQLLSGSIDTDGVVTVRALRAAAESQYEQIIKLVRAASNSQSPFVRLADRYSIPFTAISFVIAIAAWLVSGHAIRFLEVLVVATPCPLILAAPIAVISGMSRAARSGIIIKTGSALEKLAEAQTVAFDKTGTLTNGTLEVDAVTTYEKFKKADVLSYAAALEQNSNHVLAQAILTAAHTQKVKILKTKKITETAGRGVQAVVSGRQVLVGRLSLLEAEHVVVPKKLAAGVKQTATFVAIDGKLAGLITFRDEIRPEAKVTLKALLSSGIQHILMVTGDNQVAATAIAKKLGITEVKAEALPADKLLAIEAIKERPVVFVGDGVNDAPVLTAADIGIALGARGETAASESADMVIMLDDVSKVAQVYDISRRTFAIAKQSILVGIALSLVLMVIFSTGHFRPLYGAILQEGVDVVVIFNALRAHGGGPKAKAVRAPKAKLLGEQA